MTRAARTAARSGLRQTARLLLLACGLLLAEPVSADEWYEHHEAAAHALEQQRWAEAIEQLNLAISKKGDSSPRARTYGMNVSPYFPYLMLARAYYELEQLEAASQALETERQLGAIERSRPHHVELDLLARQIRLAGERSAAEEQRRIEQIVQQGLADAARLEDDGELQQALEALGRVLSVAPGQPEAELALERIAEARARRDDEAERERQREELLTEARRLLDSGQLEQARAAAERALSLRPDGDALELRERAEQAIQERLKSTATAERRQMVASAVTEARRLEAAGDVMAALSSLQPALALEPDNREALALKARLLATQEEEDRRSRRAQRLGSLGKQLEQQLAEREFEQALATANHLLALQPGDPQALSSIAHAHRELGRILLGQTTPNFPPAIRFADYRGRELDSGLRVEQVRDPAFRLSGTVIDDEPVEVAFESASGVHASGQSSRTLSFEPIADEGKQLQIAQQGVSELVSVRDQQLGGLTIREFTLHATLPPGLSHFRVRATDRAGLSSQAEYSVLYVVPWYRSRWPYLAGLSLALAGLASGGLRGWRRRQRLLRRRFNPYVAGAPVLDEQLFFGRQPLIDRILQTVHNNSLLLYGERRIGKTSLQHHLRRRLGQLDDPRYSFHPVYIDLQGTPEERFFATIASDVFDELAPVLDGLRPASDPADASSYGYRELLRDLRAVLARLAERSPKQVKLVLLMDEIDQLNAYDPRINQRLRSLFMKSFADQLVAVVSGVQIKKHWESEGSPWYNFFEEIEVPPLSIEEAHELVRTPIAGVFKLAPGVVERIVELSGCRPYAIQKLCMALVNHLHQQGRRNASLADVEAVARVVEVPTP